MFLGIFVFLIFLAAFLRKRASRDQQDASDAFWQRENEANHARRRDISDLPYIEIPQEILPSALFPLDPSAARGLSSHEQALLGLSGQKILNLEGQSNTDVKLQYGPANLEALTEYDQNFVTLCQEIASYAQDLLDGGHAAEAKKVLEFGIGCGSDLSANYLMLAELYRDAGDDAGLDGLISRAKSLSTPMAASIQRRLEEIRGGALPDGGGAGEPAALPQ